MHYRFYSIQKRNSDLLIQINMVHIIRTIFLGICMIIAFSSYSLYGSNPASDSIKLVELRCEYATNPLGIDVKTPKFSWILESTERGQMQSAYQVLVASSLDNLRNEVGDNWDSKKVRLSKSVNISYKGKLLTSGEKCYWKVNS